MTIPKKSIAVTVDPTTSFLMLYLVKILDVVVINVI
jgi:hypothetical protein